jgi:NhaC family Na+:H+ antiporter
MARKLKENKELNLFEALIPVLVLIVLLAFNVKVFKDDAVGGSNQFVLLLGGAVAAVVGVFNGIKVREMIDAVSKNIQQVFSAILILLLVGSLAASWLISGIIPAMIYYGLQIINPSVFLPVSVIISAIISIATGSSWTTTATVGIALIAIGNAMGLPMGMTAGAVISGAYFGDKMSPLSDTTNLAAAMAGTDLFKHIKYMTWTTVPSIVITLIVFTILGFVNEAKDWVGNPDLSNAILKLFNITPWLFLVPIVVIALIIKKVHPSVALLSGTLLGCLVTLIVQPQFTQPDFLKELGVTHPGGNFTAYGFLMQSITEGVVLPSDNAMAAELLQSGGMKGMLGTVWLIICAMVFGGVMESIGALTRITRSLLQIARSAFGLFASTVGSCLAINLTASDQYLAIVVPGKMFQQAYKDKNLSPENLSRTLEDSGTVTSVLIPWNTCGAYQSNVLGVGVGEYFIYAVFNYLSPFMTLLFAAFRIKIKALKEREGQVIDHSG